MKRFDDKWKDQEGITFFIHGWEPENGNPKALVGLVHGLGEHAVRYAHVGKVLAKSGYALAGFDLRGHGKSGGERGHVSSLDAYMQDIRQFFGLMERKYPDIPHFLYGHSLGGLLVLAYTIQYGAHLQGVIATGPGLRSSLQEQKAKVAIVRLLGSVLPAMTLQSGLDAATISRDSAIVEAYKNDPLVHDRASLGLGKAALSAIDLCFARAKEFPVPLLIMHGRGDKIAYSSGSEDFAELLRAAGKDVTLKLWDDLYHEVHNEPEKEEVFRFIIDWLDKHL
ncbi:MAG TPA: lysophospholipase [Anaerolineales bacterium]|nr:lysophospholipase [Anaerolineales bacterium]